MKKIIQKALAVLDRKEKRQFSLFMMLDIFVGIADIASLALLLWIIQFYIQPGRSHSISFLPGWLANSNSALFIGIFFFLFGLKNLVAFLIAKAWYRFAGRVAVRISRNNLSGYQHAGYEDFVNIDSSVHIRKIAYQPFEFCQYILSGIQQITTQAVLITLAVVAIILFNAKLFLLLLLIILPPVTVLFYLIKNRLGKLRNEMKSGNEWSFKHLMDALKGYVEGNIYNRNDFFLQRFVRSRQQFSSSLFESISIQQMPPRIIEVFAILGLFLLIAIAKWSGTENTDYLVTIGAFMAAAYKIIPGFVKIINTSGQMRAYEFSVNDFIHAGPEIKSLIASPADIQAVQFNHVHFAYHQQPVLHDFSFCAAKGDFIGIKGESGKGKTTIFNLLLGFLEPEKGEIVINDSVVKREDIAIYWPHIAYVRQQTFLIHDTILRNVTLQETDYNEKDLQNALTISGLDKMLSSSPEGLQKMITENGKNISGGQQQRIALARALYKKSELTLLDEPFNELDEASAVVLLEYFRELARAGKTVIMIAHDSKSLSYCNKIISLDEQV